MTEHRCTKCKGLLCKGNLAEIEVVCHRCKTLNKISYISQKHLYERQPVAIDTTTK